MSDYENVAPRVYVGTYWKYNNGNLFGKWLNLNDYDDDEEFREACLELHKDEVDPEIMFQDYEGFPGEFYDESSINEKFWEWKELDDNDKDIYDGYVRCFGQGDDIKEAIEKCEGKYDSMADYAKQFCEDCYDMSSLPDFLQSHIDWECVGRDFGMDLSFDEETGYAFNPNR